MTSVKKDLDLLEINLSFSEIEKLGESTFMKLIKNKIRAEALKYLVQKKTDRNGKGREIQYMKLEMQEYLTEEWDTINNFDRKLIFQLRAKMHFKIKKSHFRNMHFDTICDGCRQNESTSKHTLECKTLIGQNEIVTYIPTFEHIYENDVNEQIYIARLIEDNLRRLPVYNHIIIDEE